LLTLIFNGVLRDENKSDDLEAGLREAAAELFALLLAVERIQGRYFDGESILAKDVREGLDRPVMFLRYFIADLDQGLEQHGHPELVIDCEEFRSVVADKASKKVLYIRALAKSGMLQYFGLGEAASAVDFLPAGDVLIHPDMADLDMITARAESIRLSDFRVSPTSSSRTVEILDAVHSGYAKLNYKGMIGRADRQLTRNHAISAVELTDIVKNAILSTKLPSTFAFLPEPGARVVLLSDDDGKDYEWGMVFREADAFPCSNTFAFVIPTFSLFSTDVNHPNDPLLLLQLIDIQDTPPAEYLFEKIIEPLISCYFQLLITCALQLECHAQNALIGFDDRCQPKAIIFRDLESVDKDLSLAEDLHIDVRFQSAPYKCLQRQDYNYTIMHSFMYDFKLGEYLITPLIDALAQHYKVDPVPLIQNIKTVARKFVALLPDTFFPSDGTWFHYENIIHDRTARRPYIARPDPKYR
jgi:hypothetical protein